MSTAARFRSAQANYGVVRLYAPVRGVLLLLAIAAPFPMLAQFQQPTDEELKMIADPKAPGASAVYLYHEEDSDGPAQSKTYYERIKVLTEKGKELATVSIPYEPSIDKVANIEGRTIHADGTVIPLTAKPSDLMDVKTKGYQLNSVVFTLPSVEVGSILEYRLKFKRDEDWTYLPTWEVQKPYFIQKAHYSFILGSVRIPTYAAYLGDSNAKVQHKKDAFTLDIADIPPEPDDDWMPPLNILLWHVQFYFPQFRDRDIFWNYEGRFWAGWVEDFTKPTVPMQNAISGIVAPDDSEELKAEKIYAAVMKLENTSFTRQKSDAERKKEKLKSIEKAEDVWKQRAGNENEIALLYVALARAAGLKVSPMYVVDRSLATFDKAYLSEDQFDDYIVIVGLGSRVVYLDPGQKMCPFGSLHWKHTMTTGLRRATNSAVLSTTPAFTSSNATVDRTAVLDIDETGNVKGTVRFVMTGPNALYWRQRALENDEEEVKKEFKETMQADLPEGVEADFDHFLGLEDYNANLIGIVKVSGNIGSATGKHFFLPGLFFQSRAKHPFVALDKRTIPVDVHFPNLEQDDVTYNLPPGFNVESLPQDANANWPDYALLRIHSSVEDGSVKVLRTMAYNFTLLDPKEYTDLHDFYLKVATADQQQLVLTRAPVAKGN